MTDHRDRRPRRLTHGSLFTGIGGFDLGFQWASIDTVWQVEQSEFCRTILERHFPDATRHKDVREVGARNLCRVDIISGGSPCQDISGASPRRMGLEGERSGLWREMRRICAELLPRWCIFENVPELRARGADTIASAMEDLGYSCTPIVVGAHAVGAPHERDRVWLVSHLNESDGAGARRLGSLSLEEEGELFKADQEWRRVWNELGGTPGDEGRASYRKIRRKFHGVSRRMDRVALAALGNAVVPQIAMLIGSYIRQYEEATGGSGNSSHI
jgi:DNA (cytosine-5)-methyltransferase 1